jgi:hypothetical protein
MVIVASIYLRFYIEDIFTDSTALIYKMVLGLGFVCMIEH